LDYFFSSPCGLTPLTFSLFIFPTTVCCFQQFHFRHYPCRMIWIAPHFPSPPLFGPPKNDQSSDSHPPHRADPPSPTPPPVKIPRPHPPLSFQHPSPHTSTPLPITPVPSNKEAPPPRTYLRHLPGFASPILPLLDLARLSPR